MTKTTPGNLETVVREVSDKIRQMRAAKPGVSWATPSRYWTDYVSLLEYMLDPDIPVACFKRLRHHTFHITGSMPAHYIQGWHASLIDLPWLAQAYKELSAKLPSHYRIAEPDALGGFGIEINGVLVNADIVRFMSALVVLWEAGILQSLESKATCNVLELGGGWGGLAHHFTSLMRNCRYFIIDLPEILLFSACYLSLLNPKRKLYLYDEESYSRVRKGDFAGFDFVCLPNWTFSDFEEKAFDLVINQASFQEMTTAQVQMYLDGISRICRGHLYSFNQDFQDYNSELGGLIREIDSRFEATEYFPLCGEASGQPRVVEWLVAALMRECKRISKAVKMRLQHRSFVTANPSRHLLCVPRGASASPPEKGREDSHPIGPREKRTLEEKGDYGER